MIAFVTIIVIVWIIIHSVLFLPTYEFKYKPDIPYSDLYIPVVSVNDKKCHDKIRAYRRRDRPTNKQCINIWHFHNYPHSKTVLHFHGNYGNIGSCDYIIDICRRYRLNLVVVDYRGYGRSDGHASVKNFCQDAATAYLYLTTKVDPGKIIIWGESLGGAAASYVASKYPCRSLVLFSTFSSVDDILNHHTKFPIGPIVGTMMDSVQSSKRIRHIKCPIAILHSDEDTLIPVHCAHKMYRSICHNCKIFFKIGGDHGKPIVSEKTLIQLLSFCDVDLDFIDKHNLDGAMAKIKEMATREW